MRKLRRAGNKGTRKLAILQLPLEGLVVGRKLSLLFRIPLKGPHKTPQHGENGLLARTEWRSSKGTSRFWFQMTQEGVFIYLFLSSGFFPSSGLKSFIVYS